MSKPEYIYGHWPVQEALKANRRTFEQLLLAERVEDRGILGEIVQLAHAKEVPVKHVPRHILDDLSEDAKHQNVVLRTEGYIYEDADDMLDRLKRLDEKPFLLLLDLLQDPQNVGSLMRVADAVGVHGVVLQDRRAVSITPAVSAASSGAVEHLHVSQVTNLVHTMKELKEQDVWMVGVDLDAEAVPIDQPDLDMGVGIVLGSEGEGMRRLVRETCDVLVTLPMRGQIASLNVATAGSVALYTAWQARGWLGWTQKTE